jgi:glycolate oxidase
MVAALGLGELVSSQERLQSLARDQAQFSPSGTPQLAVFPRSTAEVSAAVAIAADHRMPIVTRGAGTGLSGGANAVDGCLLLCTERMNAVLSVDPRDQLAVVQPGVLTTDVAAAAADAGLFYPPDPSSMEWSTIGGNIATNAGGLCCIRYGVTRDYVLALEVVLADGSVMRVGRRTRKGVAGYDLVSLIVGSEGTLAIITEATLRLRPPPPPRATLVASFPSLTAAGQAVAALLLAELDLSLLELMDAATVRAVAAWKRMDFPEDPQALLLLQLDSTSAEQLRVAESTCLGVGASYVVPTRDTAEGEELLAARRFALPALEKLGSVLLDDIAVPVSQLAAVLSAITAVGEQRGLTIGTFGHAGDGNLHPTVVYDAADDAAQGQAQAAFEDIIRIALDAGGTVTGEHGVGLLKRDALTAELDPVALKMHAAVKAVFDPWCLLNPGKVVDCMSPLA